VALPWQIISANSVLAVCVRQALFEHTIVISHNS
jgi:hypothetical protein